MTKGIAQICTGAQGQIETWTVDTARAHYSHQVTEFLLLKFAPVVEEVTGKKVFPTYSYMRIYKHGSELKKHKDRAACEFTLSIALGCDSRDPWPIHLDTGTGPRAVTISAGDGVLFRGCDLFHWRDRFEGTYCAQVFLHFVDQDGPAADQKFDGRAAIGAPASRTPGTNAG